MTITRLSTNQSSNLKGGGLPGNSGGQERGSQQTRQQDQVDSCGSKGIDPFNSGQISQNAQPGGSCGDTGTTSGGTQPAQYLQPGAY